MKWSDEELEDFYDAPEMQEVEIVPPVTCGSFTMRILSIYPAEKWSDIEISEIEVAGSRL